MAQWAIQSLPDLAGDQWKPQSLRLRGIQTQYNPMSDIFSSSLKSNTTLTYFLTITLVSAEYKVTLAQFQVYLFHFLATSFNSSSRHTIKHNVSSPKPATLQSSPILH